MLASTLDTSQMKCIIPYISTSQLEELILYLELHNTLDELIKETNVEKFVSKFAHHLSQDRKLELKMTSNHSKIIEPTHDEVMQVNKLLLSVTNIIKKQLTIR